MDYVMSYIDDSLINIVKYNIHKILSSRKDICMSHDIDHMFTVYKNSAFVLSKDDNLSKLPYNIKRNIKLAAILHDIDDKKFFPNNTNNDNARYIINICRKYTNLNEKISHISVDNTSFADFMTYISNNYQKIYDANKSLFEISFDDEDEIIRMIDLVSTSNYGNFIPDYLIKENKLWMLIPRWCDRLEALGNIGIYRCYQYNKSKKMPLYLDSTKYTISLEELRTVIAPPDRFKKYNGNSLSMIDHFYDKLLHLKVTTGIPILDNEMEKRMKNIENFCLEFGKNKCITDEMLDNIKNNQEKMFI